MLPSELPSSPPAQPHRTAPVVALELRLHGCLRRCLHGTRRPGAATSFPSRTLPASSLCSAAPMLGALLSQVVEHPNPITVRILRRELAKVVGSGPEILDDERAPFLPLRIELIDLR